MKFSKIYIFLLLLGCSSCSSYVQLGSSAKEINLPYESQYSDTFRKCQRNDRYKKCKYKALYYKDSLLVAIEYEKRGKNSFAANILYEKNNKSEN